MADRPEGKAVDSGHMSLAGELRLGIASDGAVVSGVVARLDTSAGLVDLDQRRRLGGTGTGLDNQAAAGQGGFDDCVPALLSV